MIITRTPFRISFFGGGTDYPGWYSKHGGAVISAAIDKYCYLSCRYLPPFFEHRHRIVYSKIENCKDLKEIQHPAVREILRYVKITEGIEIHHDGDLPARSGIGTSSAFTVGLLNGLRALKGQMISTEQLAKESIYIEQEILKETVGSQDQIIAAYGGLNNITFFENGEFTVKPMTLSQDRMIDFHSHLMLFYTGIVRTASKIATTYVGKIDNKERQMRFMQDLVKEACQILASSQDIESFGKLLHEAWKVKRELSSKVTNPQIDEMYSEARSAGALGGKITGAGGGGFMLLFAPPERHEKIKKRLRHLLHVPFKFEFSGSRVIFFSPIRKAD